MHDLPLAYTEHGPTMPSERPPLIVLLHGYGANEHDLIGLAPMLDPRLLTLSPRAPLVLAPFAYAWFEIAFTSEGIAVDAEQARRSLGYVVDFVRAATSAYNAHPGRVFLVGFSQGATMAALTTLSTPGIAAATAVLSGIVPDGVAGERTVGEGAQRTPFFVGHGRSDTVVPVAHGRATRKLLEDLQAPVSYHEYDMGHAINDACVRDLAAWLTQQLDRVSQ